MNRLQKPVWYFAGFGLAGLISSVVTLTFSHLHWMPRLAAPSLVGIIFGLFIAACFWIYIGLRSVWAIALFICSCVAAFYLSAFSATFWHSHVPAINSLKWGTWGNWGPGADVFFVGGYVGGFVVLAAALLSLLPQQAAWRVLLKACAWSVVAGLLGALGYGADTVSAEQTILWFNIVGSEGSTFLVWQTGMALLLALIFRLEQRSSNARPIEDSFAGKAAITPRYSLSAFRMIFFAVILVLLAYFLQWDFRTNHKLSP